MQFLTPPRNGLIASLPMRFPQNPCLCYDLEAFVLECLYVCKRMNYSSSSGNSLGILSMVLILYENGVRLSDVS